MTFTPKHTLEDVKTFNLYDINPDEQESIIYWAKETYYNDWRGSFLSDDQFDVIFVMLKGNNPDSPLLGTGISVQKGALKAKLPYHMGSMDKIKDNTALARWVAANQNNVYVVSDKLDGISMLYTRGRDGKYNLYTRGDGTIGSDVTHIIPNLRLPEMEIGMAVRGELIMSDELFEKYKQEGFSNPRNMVAGIANRKELSEELLDVRFVAFERLDGRTIPSQCLDILSYMGFDVVTSTTLIAEHLNVEYLTGYLEARKEYSPYAIDGLIIEADVVSPVNETGNPKHAAAFKTNALADKKSVRVKGVEWGHTRLNQLKPTVLIEDMDGEDSDAGVQFDGRVVKRVTGHHAKYIIDNGIGIGAVINVIISGDVIPYITEVVESVVPLLPDVGYTWDATNTNILANESSRESEITQLTFSIVTLGIENIATANTSSLYDCGFKSLVDIQAASESQLMAALGTVRGKELYRDFSKALENCDLNVLMYASGAYGQGFGTRKTKALLEAYPNFLVMSDEDRQGLEVPVGYSNKTLTNVIENTPKFLEMARDLGFVKEDLTYKVEVKDGDLRFDGYRFVFTGFRDKDMEKQIVDMGGAVSGSPRADKCYVITKDVNASTSKLNKARTMGATILGPEGARELLG